MSQPPNPSYPSYGPPPPNGYGAQPQTGYGQPGWGGVPPGYGYPPPKKKAKWPWILGGIVALFFLMVACTAALGVSSDSTSSSSSRSSSVSVAADPARLDPATYGELTERDFALIAKDPDAAKGRKVIIYGRVTQFDAATGNTQFRADTSGIVEDSKWGYGQNSIVDAGDKALVADVVDGDILKMFVEVKGSYSYDTQIGGRTTVPRFALNVVEQLDQP
ncbi:hypothetical protein [Prescottella equi]|uniref:hypothetical protein n=1 Tax=Rhodococcus hoagii TaxID=43767 RepID=UPI001C7948DF|nr:hypothetical protein [Prescottella equi]BCN44706.1 hypothetical protein RE9414_29860 [Prescottella equi]